MKQTMSRIIGTEMEYGFTRHVVDGQSVQHGELREALLPLGLEMVGTFLTNGGRLYNDMGHKLEYATPEALGPYGATVAEFAGERVLQQAFTNLVETEKIPDFPLRKRVVDDQGNTWGYHENYLVRRDTWQDSGYETLLIGHLATRTVFGGAGQLIPTSGNHYKVIPAQKMHDISVLSGSNSTGEKALFNTRDESHANSSLWARQHVVCGDANVTPLMTFIRLGSTSAVIRLAESKFAAKSSWLHLKNPLRAAHLAGVDTELKQGIEVSDGMRMTPLNYQQELVDQCQIHADKIPFSPDERLAITLWAGVINDLTSAPDKAKKYIEWLAKTDFFAKQLDRHKPDKQSLAPMLWKLDAAWDNIDPSIQVGQRWINKRAQELLQTQKLFTEESIIHAFFYPPETRAKIRAQLIHEYRAKRAEGAGPSDVSVNWSEAMLDWGERIVMPDPYATELKN